jgi:hypothetical protein
MIRLGIAITATVHDPIELPEQKWDLVSFFAQHFPAHGDHPPSDLVEYVASV